jgi:PTS system N-acetylglucosamine-specific IIC component
MSGFFPVMMFGLPGACLAMYSTARPERRRLVGGLLLSMALTSFLTGVTEPIEFAFMFLAPALYAVHAVLTGTAMVLMHVLGVRLGFGFSAGLFDYVLNFRLAQKPLWLLPIGAAYFALYFGLFRWAILRFDLRTPGREPLKATTSVQVDGDAGTPSASSAHDDFVSALGGPGNLRSVDACTTRLRLEVVDQQMVDEAALRRLGAHGLVRPSATALQVVLGPVADQVAERIRRQLRSLAAVPGSTSPAVATSPAKDPGVATRPSLPAAASPPRAVIDAFGGTTNVAEVASVAATRLRVVVHDETRIDGEALAQAAPRGSVRVADRTWHVIVGPG